ncbi:MAG: NUDIX hydrolase [Candidatus Cyclobacteriaceae bacterium M2_1C_046]
MNLFINDVPVQLLNNGSKIDTEWFSTVVNAEKEPITPAKLINHVWIKNAHAEDIDRILGLMNNSTVSLNLVSLTITVEDYEFIKKFIKKKFKIIKAAGGVVRKGEKLLMIYRLKRWDLPKGKLEKKETENEAAQREVEEECNVKIKMGDKICSTWHTYTMKKKNILKKTTWYAMDIVDDKKMKPEIAEDIEDVRWMNPRDVYHALESSYKSIAFVLEEYNKMKVKV